MALEASERRLLLTGAERLSVSLDPDQVETLGRFVDLLDIWRKRMSLVSARSRAEILSRHVLDALAVAPLISAADAPRVLDIGSGAGLPGVPVAIARPRARVTLLEPRRKRASFLRAVSRECSTWNIAVAEGRCQDLRPRDGELYDVVLSRAAFPVAELPSVACDLVRPGGLLIGFTRHHKPPPLQAPRGFEAPRLQPYALPDTDSSFALAIWIRATT